MAKRKWVVTALAEAGRLYNVRQATDGEKRMLNDLLDLGMPVREAVDRLFSPKAPAYAETGGLQQFFASHS